MMKNVLSLGGNGNVLHQTTQMHSKLALRVGNFRDVPRQSMWGFYAVADVERVRPKVLCGLTSGW